jgi:phenylacetate-CoA ligase
MWPERVYSLLPVPLQDLATSAKGWQLHRARYRSASFQQMAKTLARNEQLSSEALIELQFSMFQEFAAHCYTRSPYYHNLWKSHGIQPGDIRRAEDVRLIPIARKQHLRSRTREFLTEPVGRQMTAVNTSGTTGSPLTVYFSADDIGKRYAFLDRCRRWAGVRVGQRRASFTGRTLIPQRQTGAPFWRHNYPGSQLLFSSYHLSRENLPAYVEALERFQPEIIDGYPSAIHIVADHILREGGVRGVQCRQVSAILVSAETVFPHQRETIEAAFQAKLYNQYASSDGAPFVSECSHGQLHVHVDSGLMEILDDKGGPTPPGQVGQMVVTSFTTQVVPMLRFEMGDAAVPSDRSTRCACGLPFPVVEAIVGRGDDILCTPDRGLVGRMDTVFKGVPSTIIEAQIVQTAADTIVLRIVVDRAAYKAEHGGKVLAEMRKKLGDVVTIRLEEFESLPRSANGKLRTVVNLCNHLLPKAFQSAPANGSPLTAIEHEPNHVFAE